MKINRILTSVVFCLALTLALTACNNPERKSGEATAYGVTEGCPFYARITVDGDGKILEAEFDEYLSVYDIGRLDASENGYSRFGTAIKETSAGYAKFVRVGEQVFVHDGEKYVCPTSADTDKTFEACMESGGARAYIRSLTEGDFDIVDENGKDYGVSFDEYDGYKLDKTKWGDKLANGYHEGVEYDNGWKEDIYKLATHLKNHAFYGYTGKEKPGGSKKTYKVGRYNTLVTLENFHDYMRVAQKAYEEARNNVK